MNQTPQYFFDNSTNKEYLIVNIGELISCAGAKDFTYGMRIEERHLGHMKNAWLAFADGVILDLGEGAIPHRYHHFEKISAEGGLVTPGFVDSHTHLVFKKDRSYEFCQRIAGKTYQEIASMGGGIASSVKDVRNTSDEELLAKAHHWAHKLSEHGSTVLEAKTGYGLSLADEWRSLKILDTLKKSRKIGIIPTLLALHAHPLPADGLTKSAYIESVTEELLPKVAPLAKFVDVFLESGYYSAADAERYAQKAKSLGLGLRVHADEFQESGGAEFAAKHGAKSADHLQAASERGIAALAAAKTVATILPLTSLYSRIPYTQGRHFIEGGCSVAIATDFNPGSAFIPNLPLAAALAALYGGMSLPEVFAGITFVAAYSLGIERGALLPGYSADVLIHPHRSLEAWLGDFGQTRPIKKFIGRLDPC